MASSSRTGEALSLSRRILITGGARAGKSRFAQRLAEQGAYRRRLYVATAVACDPEMRNRIARHRKERGRCAEAPGAASASRSRKWETLEEPLRLPDRLPLKKIQSPSVFLLDCFPTFLTNLLLEQESRTDILRRFDRLFQACRRPGLTVVWVTNEVGLGLVPDHALGRQFRDLLGEINQQAAAAADEVYLLVAGLPARLK